MGLGVNEGAVVLDALAEFDIDCALLAGRYTLLEQAALDDLLPQCVARNVSILLGGAFNSGILARGVQGDLKFNYGAAPGDVVERVARLEMTCIAHDVPLAAAALQFPYAHPAVATVLTGARGVPAKCARTWRRSSARFPSDCGGRCAAAGCSTRARRCRKTDVATRIDAHQHYWNPARGDYGWLTPALDTLYRAFGPADLAPLLARAGIQRTVVVQAAPTVDETRYLLDLARDDASIAGVVGWVPLLDAGTPALLAELARQPKFKGVRPMLQDLPDDTWIANPALAPAIDALVAHDLAFDALIYSRHVEALVTFATRFPALRIVIDHGAKPPVRDEDAGWRDWAAGIARLARLPQGALQAVGTGDRSRSGMDWRNVAALCRPSAGIVRSGARNVGQRLAGVEPERRLSAMACGGERVARVIDRRGARCGFGANAVSFYRL